MLKSRLITAVVGAVALTGLVAPLAGAAEPAIESTGQGTQTTILKLVIERLDV